MTTRTVASSLLAAIAISAALVTTTAAAHADPRPDPWVQGQVDAQTEDIPGCLISIDTSGIDRGDINDHGLVMVGHKVYDQIYSGRGDISGAALPHTQPDNFHTMEIDAGASIKYLRPRAAPPVGQTILNAAP
ncbi:hypothetical protein C5E45_19110 [Nocardia nova]|uniref:Uncharacterized protein n=1 Tax=Nocardia nova TaxID=37330 RepID=A0A2S6AMV1_9NOCA|nr:hypothetical protein [Nocardia nova]PPJ36539.1 hypothetical protein C5E45_19110 [Nocardia nova]